MSRPPYAVLTTPRFDRMLRSLSRRHPDLIERFAAAIDILRVDPYNRGREHAIRKLESVRQGSGQYRLRLGRWRFRYDIYDRDVVLHYCGLRREDTYR
jgi:mRNA-degrading endonuclease RelE of RelBE toxin-antitoxin system